MTSSGLIEFRGRLSEYYLVLLAGLESAYKLGGERVTEALRQFDAEWLQIRDLRSWVEKTMQEQSFFSIQVFYYPLAAELLEIRLPARERIKWIETAIKNVPLIEPHLPEDQASQFATQKITHYYRLGKAYREIGEYENALEQYNIGLKAANSSNSLDMLFSISTEIGLTNLYIGNNDIAEKFLLKAIQLAEQVSHHSGLIALLISISTVKQATGDYEQALDYAIRASELASKIDDKRQEVQVKGILGGVYATIGQLDEALKYLFQALDVTSHLHLKNEQRNLLSHIAIIFETQSEWEKALENQKNTLVISRELKDHISEVRSLRDLGHIYFSSGNYDSALQHYNEALTLAHEIESPLAEINILAEIGSTFNQQRNNEKAIEVYVTAMQIAGRIGAGEELVKIMSRMGNLYQQLNDFTNASYFFEKALQETRRMGLKIQEIHQLMNLVLLAVEMGDNQKALNLIDEAKVIATKNKLQNLIEHFVPLIDSIK